MTPDAVHKVRMLIHARNLVCTGLAPVRYCVTAVLVPSGRIRPTARKISRTKTSLLPERDKMEASTRMAGKNVRMAENAAPLATPKASCSKARQNDNRKCRKKRDITYTTENGTRFQSTHPFAPWSAARARIVVW